MVRVLKQVQGVADVVSIGGFVKEFHVEVDPEKLYSLGLSLDDVSDALTKSNRNVGGGLMRRGEQSTQLLTAGRLVVDPRARIARVDDAPLPLSPKEYALLELLLGQRGRVLARATLFDGLYDARSEASDKVIEVLMSNLRGKLARAGLPELIQTRRGFGYVAG